MRWVEQREEFGERFQRCSCKTKDTTGWQMAKFYVKWTDVDISCSRREEISFSRDCLLKSEDARKAFNKYWSYLVLSNDESRHCALYWFGAIISQSVDCFVDMPGAFNPHAETVENNLHTTPELGDGKTYQKRCCTVGTTSQLSIRELKCPLSIAATSLINRSFRILLKKGNCIWCGSWMWTIYLGYWFGASLFEKQEKKTNHLIKNAIQRVLFYCSFIDAFKTFVCNCIRLVNDCSIFHASSFGS